MKIAILTQPLQNNYGGVLQAFALQHVLSDLGHEAVVLNMSRMDDYLTARNIANNINKKIRGIVKYVLRMTDIIDIKSSWYDVAQKDIRPFIDKYIKKTRLITSPNQLSSIFKSEEFEAIIVGSDQVWRPMYSPNIENYFLDFCKAKSIKRYSYAASFGVDKWEFSDSQTVRCGELLKKFDDVSVRENTAIGLCDKYLHHSATQVLDPTLLLDRKDYEDIVQKSGIENRGGNLFTYILDDYKDLTSIIRHIENCHSLRRFKTMPQMQLQNIKKSTDVPQCIYPSVESWLRSFMDAEFVLTDSFHGCVFSIIFNKPFIALGNAERGQSRFKSLLSLFGLEDRLCTSIDDVIKISRKPIDWEKVNHIKRVERRKSLEFLQQI